MTRGTPHTSVRGVEGLAGPPRGKPIPLRSSTTTFSKFLVIVLAGLFVLGTLAFLVGVLAPRAASTPSPAPEGGALAAAAAVGIESPAASIGPLPSTPIATLPPPASLAPCPVESAPPSAVGDPAASPDASTCPSPAVDPPASALPAPSVDPAASPAAVIEARMPFVPVVRFWSTTESIDRSDLVAALKGQGNRYSRVLVPTGDRAAIEEALGILMAQSVQDADPAGIIAAVKRGALGILRASDVEPSVRALGIDGKELFGNERVKGLDGWPLVAEVTTAPERAWSQRSTWTLVAGGDSFTDRGVYERVVNRNKGMDYVTNGGTARVTGHYCCGPFIAGNDVPSYELTGNKGAFRRITRGADLAIANHESPIPDNAVFHLHGTTFSSFPRLTEIFVRAGIDWFSLANNHIGDFGDDGIMDTRRNLDRYGIKFGGIGRDLTQARKITYMDVRGTRVALLSCDDIAPAYWAGENEPGSVPCRGPHMREDIQKADARADVVIVFPHWGIEYKYEPTDGQRKLAKRWTAAGADLVLGAHSHVVGTIEPIGDSLVFYSLGNFMFDMNWATYVMESVFPEMTFHGGRLVQVRLHPILLHDQAQLNLLNPRTDDGRALLRTVRRVSNPFMDW
jgi:poly-gamma-glutamate synthesis protein (capsule biosynthesis protein)